MKGFYWSGFLIGYVAVATLTGCGSSPLPAGARASGPLAASLGANSGAERVLYAFSGGNDGGTAATGLVADRHGNLYGTTVVGGALACGTVFELAPQPSPPWKETVLHAFGCDADGKNPHGGVTLDAAGNLYGTTVAGGTGVCAGDGCGIVFQLTAAGENVLHDFSGGNDGFGPGAGVAVDSAGRAYGTTPDGGAYDEGTVYELSQTGKGWRERVIHAFTGGKDGGVGSLGNLLLDASGNLYGVTEIGGAHGAGTVFELSPSAKSRYRLRTLYAFKGTPDAGSPYGGLVADASGSLYGTTYYGGAKGLGAIFELARSAKGRYRERVLYSFQGGTDGSSSTSTLAFGTGGELYGTASAGGGSCDCGTIFKLDVRTRKERTLHRFAGGTDGAYPYYGLTADASGNFYGTTVAGGSANQGTVFELTP